MTKLIYGQFYGMNPSNILFFMFGTSILWHLLDIGFSRKSEKLLLWKKCNLIGMLIASIAIVGVTMVGRGSGEYELVLQPFRSFNEAKIQPEIYRSMFMNVFLFFPLGLTLPYALPEKLNCNALLTILFALTFSIVIEYLQYHYHLGRAETDDVLCNTLGAFIGTLSYTLSRKFDHK